MDTHPQQTALPHHGHEDQCNCKLCEKEREIEDIKKQRAQLHLQSSYKFDFRKNSKTKRKEERRSESCLAPINLTYLELQSTYGKQYSGRQGEVTKFKPVDNIHSPRGNGPASTTYLRSYHSTITPRPDSPMRSPEMPVGANSIPFSAESIYQKAFKNQQPGKPSLPIIQRQNLSLPKTIGAVKSTQRDSYAAMNPERQTNPAIIPINNLGTLTPFSHNFDTTYRNFFVGMGFKSRVKHDVDEIGNINWKPSRMHRKGI